MKRSKCSGDDVQIEDKQAGERLGDSLGGTDQLRIAGATGLVHGKKARLSGKRRERARLEAKHGANSDRVIRLDRQMASEHRQLVSVRREQARLKAQPPEAKEDAFILYGHVRDVDGYPVKGFRVGLHPDPEDDTAPVQQDRTDDHGRFDLVIGGKVKGKGRKKSRDDQGGEAYKEEYPGIRKAGYDSIEQIRRNTLYLRVFDHNGEERDIGCVPVTVTWGQVAYKDIVLPTPEKPACDTMRTQYLGNASSRELHNLRNEKKSCHIERIAPDRRVYFRNEAMARKAGYDPCGHCFGRKQSKR